MMRTGNARFSVPTKRGRLIKGFSLVELAVSLAVVGVAGLLVWRLVPAARSVSGGSPITQQLATVQTAVEGFALTQSRLPCPAVADDGNENCSAGGRGFVPWRALGIDRALGAIRYGVYRAPANDLAVLSDTLHPTLPPSPFIPLATYNPATTLNGLDLCLTLRRAAATPAGLTAGGVPVAYVVAHPGANGVFDGLNTVGFDLPGRAAADTYDDHMVATGLSELSTRLSCPHRLGQVDAAVRSAWAAYDLDRDAQMFLDFRNFAYTVRQTDTRFAQANVGQSALDLAIAVAMAASSISIAANSVGAGAGVIVAAALGVTAALAAQVVADVQLAAATAAEEKARQQSVGALTLRTKSTLDLAAAVSAAYVQDQKGLLP
jgi:prepilin-type N-terminal cleavage/methylation domain-containing protein